MPARKINFPVLLLCLLVVLTIGYGIFTTTTRQAFFRSIQEDLKTYDVEEPPPPQLEMGSAAPMSMTSPRMVASPDAPDVAPTVAPGVAFNYRYAYRLAAQRIAQVQEQHARACEQLGVSRCRITGMRYRVAGEENIEAMLAVKLEPGIARRFGRSGTDAVIRAEGALVEADISGTDVDTAIRSAARGIAQMREDLQRLERQLAQRATAQERSSLEHQADQLRRSIRAAEAGRDDQQESLASTPMIFQYASGLVLPSDARPSVGEATERAFGNFADGIAILFVIFVTLLPWALLALALWWIARRIGRRLPALPPSKELAVNAG